VITLAEDVSIVSQSDVKMSRTLSHSSVRNYGISDVCSRPMEKTEQ